MAQGEDQLALQRLHALPAADHAAQLVQPLFQQRRGTGYHHKCAGWCCRQQRNRKHLNAQRNAVQHTGRHACGDAHQKRDQAVNAQHPLGSGGLFIAVHEVADLGLAPEQTAFALVIIQASAHAVQHDRLAQGIHLPHLRDSSVVGAPHGHKHFQGKGCAAGHPQLVKAHQAVGTAGHKGKYQQGIQGEPAAEQIQNAVQQLIAAQQRRGHHGKELDKDHQAQPVLSHHSRRIHDRAAGGQKQYQKTQHHGKLQLAHAGLAHIIVLLFRAGDQIPLQLPQAGTGTEHNGLRRNIAIRPLPSIGNPFLFGNDLFFLPGRFLRFFRLLFLRVLRFGRLKGLGRLFHSGVYRLPGRQLHPNRFTGIRLKFQRRHLLRRFFLRQKGIFQIRILGDGVPFLRAEFLHNIVKIQFLFFLVHRNPPFYSR